MYEYMEEIMFTKFTYGLDDIDKKLSLVGLLGRFVPESLFPILFKLIIKNRTIILKKK